MKVGERLKQYLTQNGIKQRFISQQTGISEKVLSSIFNGTRRLYADEFLKIIDCLNIDLDDLDLKK